MDGLDGRRLAFASVGLVRSRSREADEELGRSVRGDAPGELATDQDRELFGQAGAQVFGEAGERGVVRDGILKDGLSQDPGMEWLASKRILGCCCLRALAFVGLKLYGCPIFSRPVAASPQWTGGVVGSAAG